jgi:hypothetical protein
MPPYPQPGKAQQQAVQRVSQKEREQESGGGHAGTRTTFAPRGTSVPTTETLAVAQVRAVERSARTTFPREARGVLPAKWIATLAPLRLPRVREGLPAEKHRLLTDGGGHWHAQAGYRARSALGTEVAELSK